MYYTRTQPRLLPGSHGIVTLNTRTRSGLGGRLFAKLFYGPGFSLADFFHPPHCTTVGYYTRSRLVKQNQTRKV